MAASTCLPTMRIPLAMFALAGCATAHGDAKSPYADHIATLKKQLAAHGMGEMAVGIEAPFVVVGDKHSLARNAQTVRWAADHFERDFFEQRPNRIIDIYLFDDADSYERGVKTITGDAPTTPYGFYSPDRGAMFMNIGTGGGTLVHELVHPYVEADFFDAPAWINEGLGSLFEQSAERDGHIIGLTNWRLAGLKGAIARKEVPSFDRLTHLSDQAFYADDRGIHYAQARYLMYYLQEKGLLRDFYRNARAARKKDPSGYETLVKTLGEKNMADFQARWQAFVKKLSFEG